MDPYVSYYTSLLNLPDSFTDIIDSPLPPSFRINKRSTFYEETKNFFAALNLPYLVNYLRDDIYILKMSRSELKRTNDRLHEVLKSLSRYGIIINQEVVSMLPVLILERFTKTKKVALDLCAAPGSKSRQLLENFDFLIANDSNKKRINILNNNLQSHFKTASAPVSYVLTNYDGKTFPYVDGLNAIVCDIPCSGDGTVRKTNFNRKTFHPEKAKNLRNLQLGILRRAIEIAKNNESVNILYSTCSMNPLENEYIIDVILKENTEIELLDLSNIFTEFDSGLPLYGNEKLRRTIRCTPSENTGGFFVALLRVSGKKIEKMKKLENPFLIEGDSIPITKMEDFIFASQSSAQNTIYILQKEFKKYFFRNVISYGVKILKREKKGYRFRGLYFLSDEIVEIEKEQLNQLIEGELSAEKVNTQRSFTVLKYRKHFFSVFKFKDRFVLYFDKLLVKTLLIYIFRIGLRKFLMHSCYFLYFQKKILSCKYSF